jgi:predicted nucleic acid-binding protein
VSLVFLDTSAIYALLVPEDEEHERSRAILKLLDETHVEFVSSSFVLQESAALLQSRIGVSAVRLFQEKVFPVLEIEWVTKDLYERAVTALLAAAKRQVSLTDWTSFEVMRKWRIQTAFAFDDHFEEQGFELLSPPSSL